MTSPIDFNNTCFSIAMCGQTATKETTGDALKLCALHNKGRAFISGGDQNLRLWNIDLTTRRIQAQDVAVGKLRREYTCMKINARDDIMYVGSKSGDVVKIHLNCPSDPNLLDRDKTPILLGCFGRHNPKKKYGKDCEKFENGVRDLIILSCGQLIIGAGDGSVEIVEERNVKFKDFKNYPNPTWPVFQVVS